MKKDVLPPTHSNSKKKKSRVALVYLCNQSKVKKGNHLNLFCYHIKCIYFLLSVLHIIILIECLKKSCFILSESFLDSFVFLKGKIYLDTLTLSWFFYVNCVSLKNCCPPLSVSHHVILINR